MVFRCGFSRFVYGSDCLDDLMSNHTSFKGFLDPSQQPDTAQVRIYNQYELSGSWPDYMLKVKFMFEWELEQIVEQCMRVLFTPQFDETYDQVWTCQHTGSYYILTLEQSFKSYVPVEVSEDAWA